MVDEWLTELYRLREADAARRQAEGGEVDLTPLNRQNQAAELLRRCQAHNLLRQVQKALLNGKGIIDIFDRTGQYDRAIALVWQGPISKARVPRSDDPEDYHYILVGARGDKLYVNGRQLKAATPEQLKTALVKAGKNPGRWKNSP